MRRALLLSTMMIVAVGPVDAQPARDTSRRSSSSSSPSDAAPLAAAWSALAAGRNGEALTAADRVLAREPWNHSALIVKLSALAAGEGASAALDAYEAWLPAPRGGRGTEDVYLLDPVAVRALWDIGRSGDAGLRIQALERLGRGGIAAARTELASVSGPAADAALASLGDVGAVERLNASASGPGDRRRIIASLETTGAASIPVLTGMLTAPDSSTRAGAASALGRLHAEAARTPLTKALSDQDPFVRSSAAVALAQLQDPAGEAQVQKMLASDVPDLQLMAAAAFEGRPGPWVETVRPLLQNQDGLVRLNAARLIAVVDPAAARDVLSEALRSENPVVRAESARVFDDLARGGLAVVSIADLRARLRDADPAVRLFAASALLQLTRPNE